MLLQQVKLENVRIFGVKRNIIFFTLFIAVGMFFVYSGIISYKNFQGEKQLFITHEKSKINLYVSYSHYGAYGFRVLYEPSPLNIFFNNSSVFENLYSTVDMTEILKVDRSYKGRNLLLKKGFFKDLAGLFFLFGSLFMVYMGMTSYKSEKHFFRFGNIVIRLVILNTLFIFLLVCFYHYPKIFGLRLSAGEEKVFTYFGLYLLLFLGFFYAAGLFIRVLAKNKQVAYISLFIFWFLSISVIPEVMIILLQKKSQLLPANETYNIKKLDEVMNFERGVKKEIMGINTLEKRDEIYQEKVEDFLNTGYRKNSKIENDVNRNIQKVVQEYENVRLIYPTGFYNFLCGEVSSKGYSGYIELVKYTLELRHRFVKYYLKKRYKSHDKKIVSFVKNDENIFKAKNRLPGTFFIGSGLTFIYTFILFIASYLILIKRLKRMPKMENPQYKYRKGNAYFVLCKNDHYKNDLFKFYGEDENTICIDNVVAEDLDQGVGWRQMFTYFCRITGIEEKKALENLRLFEIEDIKTLRRHKHKKKLSQEILLKIYCAISMAGSQEMIVVNDFLKGKSRELESQFLNLAEKLNAAGKIIVYLSTEMFLTSLPFEGSIKIDSHKSFKIDPRAVSLR